MNIKKSLTGIISALTLMAVAGCSSLPVEKSSPRKLAVIKGDLNKDSNEETILCLGNYAYHVSGKSQISLQRFYDNFDGGVNMQCFAYVTNNYPIDQVEVELKIEDIFMNDGYPDLFLTVRNKSTREEKTYSYGNYKGKFVCLGGDNYQD